MGCGDQDDLNEFVKPHDLGFTRTTCDRTFNEAAIKARGFNQDMNLLLNTAELH